MNATPIQAVNARLKSQASVAYQQAAIVANDARATYLVSKWGWEQTNVSYYAVIRRTEKTVLLVKVETQHFATDPMQGGYAAPLDKIVAKPFTRKLGPDGEVKITKYERARPWDGTPQAYTCYA